MKRSVKILSGCLCGLLLSAGGLRAINDLANPYRAITDRNVFGLLPPEPPAPPTPPTPPANIKLTGITTIFGNKRALLMVQDTAPGGKEQSYMLSEGQREGDVEVLEINERDGTVKVKNAGNQAMLTFDKDGIKPPTAPLAPGNVSAPAPGMPGMPGGPAFVPGASPVPPPAPGGLRQIPSRQVRGADNAAASGGGYGAPSKQGLNPGQNFSGQNFSPMSGLQAGSQNAGSQNTGSQNTGQRNEPGYQSLSPDEQRAHLLILNELHKNDLSWPKINVPED